MKLILLLATATCFSAATVSASKNDSLSEDRAANSHLRGGDKVTFFPIILADVTADEGGSEKPDYCSDVADYDCYKKGVPKCCIENKKECPDDPPSCDISGNVAPNESCSRDRGDVCTNGYACIDGTCQVATKRYVYPTGSCKANRDTCTSGYACVDGTCQSASAKVVGQGDVCRRIDVCVSGTVCISGRCEVPPIGPDGYCTPDDVCVNNYSCANGKCKYTRGNSNRIDPGDYCSEYNVCVSGYQCTNGRCVLSRNSRTIPRNGACVSGVDTCADGYVCLDGKCGTAQWYTNWSYCIMDCPTSAGPCCGGSAQSWDVVYSSADSCCSQPALASNRDGCVSQSLSCAREELDDQLAL